MGKQKARKAKASKESEAWGLFHSNSDGRLILWKDLKPMTKATALAAADGVRVGRGRGGATDFWTTVAGPLDTPEVWF